MDNQFKHSYLKVFIISFLVFLVSVIPCIIPTKGIWIFYGDFNVQQIPFYVHVHDAIRNGNFLYDWSTDLGGSLLGCYSFYLLGSPFFWLTIPFKSELIPYLMPFLSALKYAVMTVTAFAYAKRHLKSYTGCFVAAFLYAFSGFQGAVLVYNHFHDVMAFFPLYLLLFEKAMEEGKHVGFTLMTAFMAILNYYFFVGEVVFIIIYFAARYLMEEGTFALKIKLTLGAFIDGLTGVLLSALYIIPGVYYTTHNSRLSNTLLGYDLVTYSDSSLFIGIIKNIIMLPDISGLNSMFNPSISRVSGIGGYIPLFSVAGVIAFFLYNKERKIWHKRLLLICLVFAFVPALNSVFSALNSEYYARWYFMPILIMALVTADAIENVDNRIVTKPYVVKGTLYVSVGTVFISLCALLPAKDKDNNMTILGNLKNPDQLLSEIIFSAVMLTILFLYINYLYRKSDFVIRALVVFACLATTVTMLVTGNLLIGKDRKTSYIEQVIKSDAPINISDEDFYRIETEEDIYNYPMFWNAHSITSFISTIPDGTISFYEGLGIRRKVTSSLPTTKLGVRAILSGKYFVKELGNAIERIGRIDDMGELKGYESAFVNNDFEFYENKNYIPMGFSFDSYLTKEEYEESDLGATTKDRLLVRALILDEETASKYDGMLEHLDLDKIASVQLYDFEKYCSKRRDSACDSFKISTNGFKATVTMEKENLLFFSVPYEKGFSAYVDGVESKIEVADFGFMAVYVPEGFHEIEFKYIPSDFDLGLKISIVGIVLFAVMCLIRKIENHLTLGQAYDNLG